MHPADIGMNACQAYVEPMKMLTGERGTTSSFDASLSHFIMEIFTNIRDLLLCKQ